MMLQQKIVLVVDDQKGLHQSLAIMTTRSFPVRFIGATTLREARQLFHEHALALDAILLDGCVERRGECDTLPLIDLFKLSRFRGPIIAISGCRHIRRSMVAYGATMACEKHEIRTLLEERLFLPEPRKLVARR